MSRYASTAEVKQHLADKGIAAIDMISTPGGTHFIVIPAHAPPTPHETMATGRPWRNANTANEREGRRHV